MAKKSKIRIDVAAEAILLNRYIAFVKKTYYSQDRKNTPVKTEQSLVFQPANLKHDLKKLFTNPFKIAPHIALSLYAFWFILTGQYLEAHLTAFMGSLAYDSKVQSSHSGEPATVTLNLTVADVANRIALHFMSSLNGTGTSTFGGAATSTVIAEVGNLNTMYYLAPGTGSKDSVFSGGTIKACGVIIYNGVDQTDPFGATTSEDGSASPNDMALTTEANNSIRIDVLGATRDDATSPSMTLDQGTSRLNPVTPQNQFRIGLAVYENSQAVAGLDTYSWTSSGFNRWYAAYELKEATASSSIKTVDGLAKASVKTVNGLAIASVKTINGLA